MLPNRRTGKLAPRLDHAGITYSSRALSALPPPPPATSWVKPGAKWYMFGNDAVGDCTFATQATVALHETRIAQAEIVWPTQACLDGYRACSGWDGVPGSPSDAGAQIATVVERMASVGQDIGLQDKEIITLGIGLDHTDPLILARAVAQFGSIVCGWLLTTAMADSTNGRWDAVPGSPVEGGHCTPIVDYRTNAQGEFEWLTATWAEEFWISEACRSAQMDEAWLCASRQHWTQVSGLTPTGDTFDETLTYAQRLTA
jgi:hypothetical protein